MKYLVLLFVLFSFPVHAEVKPENIVIICSCGIPVAYGAFGEDQAFLMPRNDIPAPLLPKLVKICTVDSPFNVWHTERMAGLACPIKL